MLVVGVDPWVPLSPAFHIYQHYILLHIIYHIIFGYISYYIIFCYISYIIWYSATSTIYQLNLCHWDWVMLFVQHIAKSTSMKFLCVTWALLHAYNPNTNTNTNTHANIERNTNNYLHEVIVRVRWKGVPTCVQPKRGSSRHREVESYVGGLLRCNELES